jgi:hypothetical protein
MSVPQNWVAPKAAQLPKAQLEVTLSVLKELDLLN